MSSRDTLYNSPHDDKLIQTVLSRKGTPNNVPKRVRLGLKPYEGKYCVLAFASSKELRLQPKRQTQRETIGIERPKSSTHPKHTLHLYDLRTDHTSWVKFTVRSLVRVKSSLRLQRLSHKRRRRHQRAVLRSVSNTLDDSSTSR